MTVSVVIPLLNEAGQLPALIQNLKSVEGSFEVVAVDGGSEDGSVDVFRALTVTDDRFRILNQAGVKGRSAQMNFGATHSSGEVLLFLHADCRLGVKAILSMSNALRRMEVIGGGFFKKYNPESFSLSLFRILMNFVRTRLLHNFVGTNAIFVRRSIFEKLGGYPDVPILEEVIFCDRLKESGKLVPLRPYVLSSSRRYVTSGVFRRMWVSFKIIFLYRVAKTDLSTLHRIYLEAVAHGTDHA